jgi:hypothetical protein
MIEEKIRQKIQKLFAMAEGGAGVFLGVAEGNK